MEVSAEKYKFIDALRGYSILAVLIVHISQTEALHLNEFIKDILANGARGVQLFFIVSALTLFMSHSKRAKLERSPNFNFFIRRFFRIAPMYYLAIIYYTFQNSLMQTHTTGIFYNFTFIHGTSINWINNIVPGGWSIGVEMMFYLLFPLVFYFIKNINNAFFLLNITILLKGIMDGIIRNNFDNTIELNNYLSFYLPAQLPIFSFGILIYYLLYNETWSLKNVSIFNLSCFLILSVIYILSISNNYFDSNVAFGLILTLFILIISKSKGILINKVICYLGKLSFSIYLIHFAVIFWLTKIYFVLFFNNGIIDFLFRFTFVLIVSTIISSLSYFLIEVPFQKLANKIIRLISVETNKVKI